MTVQAHAGTEVRIASVSAGDEVFAALQACCGEPVRLEAVCVEQSLHGARLSVN